jgi:hypothetical protein
MTQRFHLFWLYAKIFFFLDFRPLKLKVKQTRMSGTNRPVTRGHTPEKGELESRRCESLKLAEAVHFGRQVCLIIVALNNPPESLCFSTIFDHNPQFANPCCRICQQLDRCI